MGYKLTSLASLPIEDEVDLYFFVVKEGFDTDLTRLIDRNFDEIARRIGPHGGAIVTGLRKSGLRMFSQRTSWIHVAGVRTLAPLILITDSHPSEISENSAVVVAPMAHICDKFETPDYFFEQLCGFAETRNTGFLDRFERRKSWYEVANEVLELKPGAFGIGVNINRLLELLTK